MLMNLRNALMAGKRLPYDAELEYLESTGTQYINTGVYANNETAVELLCKYTQSFQDNAVISMDAGSNTTRAFTIEIYNARIYFSFSDALTQNASLQSSWNQISASQNRLNVNGTSVSVSQAPAFQCEYPLFMFCYGRNGVPIIYGKWQIASCKIYQNGVLVRDFIPVRKGTVGYLYDRVSGKLFGNAGTGDFVLGQDVMPVEYIESHGAEWIDTGVDPAQDLPFECTFSGQSTSSGYGNVFGSRYSSRNKEYQLTCYNGGSVSIGSRTEYLGFGGGEKNTVSYNGTDSVNINGTTRTIQTSTCSPTTGSIVLFGIRNNGTVLQLAKGRIYGVKFGTTTNLLSVRVGTDATSWEGAMMDVLTRRIYRNAGTGAFTYGNDLKYPIPSE